MEYTFILWTTTQKFLWGLVIDCFLTNTWLTPTLIFSKPDFFNHLFHIIVSTVCHQHIQRNAMQMMETAIMRLEVVKTVLRYYRSLRTNQPNASKTELSKLITNDAILLWNKARVPTASLYNCIKRVQSAIDWWSNSFRKTKQREMFQKKIGELLDLAPKPSGRGGDKKREDEYIRILMSKTGKQKERPLEKKNDSDDEGSYWETDFAFYIDQQVKFGLNIFFSKLQVTYNYKLGRHFSHRKSHHNFSH